MSNAAQILHDEAKVRSSIAALADSITEGLGEQDGPVHLVGIHSRGADLAALLEPLLLERGLALGASGSVDIALYRDDLEGHGLPQLRATELPFAIDEARILLVDDVLFTGRTIRSALQAISEYGRVAWLKLVVYADRGHRELPIQPDFCAAQVKSSREQGLFLRLRERDGRETLELKGAQ